MIYYLDRKSRQWYIIHEYSAFLGNCLLSVLANNIGHNSPKAFSGGGICMHTAALLYDCITSPSPTNVSRCGAIYALIAIVASCNSIWIGVHMENDVVS